MTANLPVHLLDLSKDPKNGSNLGLRALSLAIGWTEIKSGQPLPGGTIWLASHLLEREEVSQDKKNIWCQKTNPPIFPLAKFMHFRAQVTGPETSGALQTPNR